MEGIKEIMKTSNMNISKDDAMQIPLVSICSITYNHAPYIRQCLDGFLMQKTNFKYEIIIHDDASTDGTAEIIKEYAEKYPDLISPVFQKENQYSKGLRGFYVRFLFPKAKGKYIALCDGDDYWTDPLKLQKQVDFLEANPDFVMCSHRFQIFDQKLGTFKETLPLIEEEFTFDIHYYITFEKWVTQPLTSIFRRGSFDINIYMRNKYNKDASLFYHILMSGKGRLLYDTMGVYRHHNNGIWVSANRQNRICADCLTLNGIYFSNPTLMAARYIYNFLNKMGYLGIGFFRKYLKIYKQSLYIIYKELGVRQLLHVLVRNCSYSK